VLEQRIDQDVEVGNEFLCRGIGPGIRIQRRQMRQFVPELAGGRRQARIDEVERAAVGFVGARGILVRRDIGKPAQLGVISTRRSVRLRRRPST